MIEVAELVSDRCEVICGYTPSIDYEIADMSSLEKTLIYKSAHNFLDHSFQTDAAFADEIDQLLAYCLKNKKPLAGNTMDNEKNPLISVVMPTFNNGHLIGRSVQSVIEQTYTNWELLIIDNNSDDNTSEVLSRLSDDRIRLFSVTNNGVIGVSRNLGIQKSRGEWIAFLDLMIGGRSESLLFV